MKQELKPVTHNGHVLLVETTPTTGDGAYYNVKAKAVNTFGSTDDIPHCFKIVAQPISSKLDGIPYYRTEEETVEELAKKWCDQKGLSNAGVLVYGLSDYRELWKTWEAGYKAAKAKEFTEDDMHMVSRMMVIEARKNQNNFDWVPKLSADDIITSLRKPRRIVSATVVTECEFIKSGERCYCANINKTDGCHWNRRMPIFYSKEIDGKMLEFLSVEIIYE